MMDDASITETTASTTSADATTDREPPERRAAGQLCRSSKEGELAEHTLTLPGFNVSQFTAWLLEGSDIDDLRDSTGRKGHRLELSILRVRNDSRLVEPGPGRIRDANIRVRTVPPVDPAVVGRT